MVKLVPAKCPSCGASLKVDRSLKFTKCEYCDTEIVVEEAVENLLKVELKDSPTLDNYLKLGNRYYENKEYNEAYKAYSKAEEIDPDNPIVVLRKGLSISMLSDYNHYDILSAVNGLKESISLMNRMSFSKKEINKSIDECFEVLCASSNYFQDLYINNNFTKRQTVGYIERMEACLDGFIYLDSVVVNDRLLQRKIISKIIETIDIILGNQINAKYNLSKNYVDELKNKKKKYELKLGTPNNNKKINSTEREKIVHVETKSSKVKDILCYLMVAFLAIMLIAAIFANDSIFMIIIYIMLIVLFIPKVKKVIVQKHGYNFGIFIVVAIILLGSGPIEFENTFKSKDGIKIVLKDGKFTMKTNDGTVKGEYYWNTKDNDYYIHVQGNNNQNYEYRYRQTSEGGSLCLLKNNECTDIYLPMD